MKSPSLCIKCKDSIVAAVCVCRRDAFISLKTRNSPIRLWMKNEQNGIIEGAFVESWCLCKKVYAMWECALRAALHSNKSGLLLVLLWWMHTRHDGWDWLPGSGNRKTANSEGNGGGGAIKAVEAFCDLVESRLVIRGWWVVRTKLVCSRVGVSVNDMCHSMMVLSWWVSLRHVAYGGLKEEGDMQLAALCYANWASRRR